MAAKTPLPLMEEHRCCKQLGCPMMPKGSHEFKLTNVEGKIYVIHDTDGCDWKFKLNTLIGNHMNALDAACHKHLREDHNDELETP